MTPELGKIDRPEASHFKKVRKIFSVPLLYAGEEAPPDYMEMFELYWEQAAEHIQNLESKLGKVNRVYHESISSGGEDGLKMMERLNPKSYQIAQEMCQNEARLEALEDKELADESMDWERCLLVGLASAKVAKKLSESYVEASKKRFQHVGKRIDETLKSEETAVLFIREGHMVQFQRDIEVFSVAPPALNEIHRWLRDRASRNQSDSSG